MKPYRGETRCTEFQGGRLETWPTGARTSALPDSNVISTTGASGHGIAAYNYGTLAGSATSIRVGGSINGAGSGAQGIRVGVVSNAGVAQRVAPIGEDGYRRQTVTVNGSVTGNAAGVFLAGGGRVVIGPRGSIGAASGIAILASGDTPGANAGDPAIKPKLRVDMNLDGRRVRNVIGDDWIINDGGETTIAVNRMVLHDGEMGVTDAVDRNGAYNVSIREDGLTVTDRTTDPWTFSAGSTSTVSDRDFSAAHFTETAAPTCSEGQVGTPRNCSNPPSVEPETPMIMEKYAPRSAVYEALPGFMLGLDAPGLDEERVTSPGSPVWARISGGRGSYEPVRASVGAEYDASRFAAEAGLDFSFGENVVGSASVRSVRGSADVKSSVGGGKIDVYGLGFSLGFSVDGYGFYAKGDVSLTRYDVNLFSSALGLLRKD